MRKLILKHRPKRPPNEERNRRPQHGYAVRDQSCARCFFHANLPSSHRCSWWTIKHVRRLCILNMDPIAESGHVCELSAKQHAFNAHKGLTKL